MKRISLSQQAYDIIKQKIVSLEMLPGSIIDEGNLQEELGFGRTPIREALKRLSLEKLVVILPRRGMLVSEIGIRDLQQLFEMRLPLEILATRLAADRGNEEQWQRMENALAQLQEVTIEYPSLIAIDKICHEIIYEAAGNEFLRDTLISHYALSLRLWYYFLPRIGDMRDALLDHKLILDALQVQEGDKAAQLMERHIRAFQQEIQQEMVNSAVPANIFGQNLLVS